MLEAIPASGRSACPVVDTGAFGRAGFGGCQPAHLVLQERILAKVGLQNRSVQTVVLKDGFHDVAKPTRRKR
jgi:hypothetical protein